MLKITPSDSNGASFNIRLCGHLTKEYLPEIERLLNEPANGVSQVSLDLANVTFVDRAGMLFLCSANARNIRIENCPSYVCRWIQQERHCSGSENTPQ